MEIVLENGIQEMWEVLEPEYLVHAIHGLMNANQIQIKVGAEMWNQTLKGK